MHILDWSIPESWEKAAKYYLDHYLFHIIIFCIVIYHLVYYIYFRWFSFVDLEFLIQVNERIDAVIRRIERAIIVAVLNPFFQLFVRFFNSAVWDNFSWLILNFFYVIKSPYYQLFLDELKLRDPVGFEKRYAAFYAARDSFILGVHQSVLDIYLTHLISSEIASFTRYFFLVNFFSVPTWFFYFDSNYELLDQKNPLQIRDDFRIIISIMLPFLTEGEVLTHKFEEEFVEHVIVNTLLQAEYRDTVKPKDSPPDYSRLRLGSGFKSHDWSILLKLYHFQKESEKKVEKKIYIENFNVFMRDDPLRLTVRKDITHSRALILRKVVSCKIISKSCVFEFF